MRASTVPIATLETIVTTANANLQNHARRATRPLALVARSSSSNLKSAAVNTRFIVVLGADYGTGAATVGNGLEIAA